MMRKLLTCLGLVVALSAASGCAFYFDDDDDTYRYCDASGCYVCYDDGEYCEPDNNAYGCTSDDLCAAGCYCDEATGVCVEAGFCSSATDCPTGYVCDDRNSCVPDENSSCWDTGCDWGYYCSDWGECIPSTTCESNEECGAGYACVDGTCQPVACDSDDDCAAGCYCDEETGACVETGLCDTDEECTAEDDTCDEDRNTCIPGEDPLPECNTLTVEADCLAREDCNAIYGGINCTPACSEDPEHPDCTCEDYYFAACAADEPPAP